jgi:hypothetical protein
MALSLRQDITYWAPGAENQFGGKVYSAPVVIKGRWEDKVENIIDDKGQDTVSKSRIYTQTEVKTTGFLLNGVSAVADPTEVADAQEIRTIGSTPNLSSLARLYTAWI